MNIDKPPLVLKLDELLEKIEAMSPKELYEMMQAAKIAPEHAATYSFLERYIRFTGKEIKKP